MARPKHPLTHVSGVYALISANTQHEYIGSSQSIGERWHCHRSLLKHGKHTNGPMQDEATQYGVESFEVHLLEVVDDLGQLEVREQFYLDERQPYFNRLKTTRVPKGYKRPPEVCAKLGKHLIGKPMSPQSREGLLRSHLGVPMKQETRDKIGNSNRGRQHSEEWKRNISAGLQRDNQQRKKAG